MFLLQAAKKYTEIGAIAPFSEHVIQETLQLIQIKYNLNDKLSIAELWSWEWGFTKKLCESFINSEIHAFEINIEFIKLLQILDYKNLTLHNVSAEFIKDFFKNNCDCIISTLPFTIFNNTLSIHIIQACKEALRTWWLFFIIQYSDASVELINTSFGSVPIYTERIMKNIPPAKILVYKK